MPAVLLNACFIPGTMLYVQVKFTGLNLH